MLRRAGWTLLSAVIGYVLAIVVTFVVLSVVYESRVNRLAVRPDRDRWAFLGSLAGLVVGGLAGWWWSGRHPAGADEAGEAAGLVDEEPASTAGSGGADGPDDPVGSAPPAGDAAVDGDAADDGDAAVDGGVADDGGVEVVGSGDG